MPPTNIALSRVVDLNVPLLWQEAVAVARAAGTLAVQSGQPISLEGFAVSTAGTVMATGVRRGLGALDVYGLVTALLDGQPSPGELRALLASRADLTASSPTLRQVEALEYFATPNPEADIAALATRALEADADDAARGAIARLRIESDPLPGESAGGSRKAPQRWTRRGRVAAGLAAIAACAAALVVAWPDAWPARGRLETDSLPNASTLVAETVSAAVRSVTSTLDAATDTALQKMGLRAASEAVAADQAAPTADARTRTVPPTSEARLPLPVNGPIMPPGFTVAPGAALVGAGTGDTALVEADGGLLDSDRIYSVGDAMVLPPALVYPQLPSLTANAAAGAAHLTLLVDETGQVSHARLGAGESSIASRMLVFAAKTWRFSPASVDGRPVKYRLQVPIEP